MADEIIVRRYARALFDVSLNEGRMETVGRDLEYINDLIHSAPDLLHVMQDPVISVDKKKDIIKRIFTGSINDTTLDFWLIMIGRFRGAMIRELKTRFDELINEYRGITTAEVVTAVSLDESQRQGLAERLSAVTGKKVIMDMKIDPSILGGVVVRIGDTVMDGSVKGYLGDLKEKLSR